MIIKNYELQRNQQNDHQEARQPANIHRQNEHQAINKKC